MPSAHNPQADRPADQQNEGPKDIETDPLQEEFKRMLQEEFEELQDGEDCSTRQLSQRPLHAYLKTGDDDPEKSMKSLVHRSLEDTAKEFPLLAKPMGKDDTESS